MSQFGADKFTTRSREVIEAAQVSATTAGNTATEPIHLLEISVGRRLVHREPGTCRAGTHGTPPSSSARAAKRARLAIR